MRTYVLTHMSDGVLLRELDALVARERNAMAAVLAHIAEVDARRLYLPAGFSSMYDYCLGKLHVSEQAAMKRIRAGRAARRFPAIFDAVADGQLHLSAVVLLAPHLNPENVAELIAAAAHQTKAEIEQLLARRFPKPDVPARLEAIAPAAQSSAATDLLSPGTVESPVPRPIVKPVAPERFALQFTIGQGTCDKLRYAQALLSHQLPSGDIAQVFDGALDALIGKLEKQKFAATGKPRPRSRHTSANRRHIPAAVKRAVGERDGGQCTFVGDSGHRCAARTFLEFDHIDPVARGGEATVENIQIRCRAHNQYEAECAFGAGFMSEKREAAERARATAAAAEMRAQAREAEAEARARAAAAAARSRAASNEHANDVMASLRELGFRAGEARRAVEFCATLPDATLEHQVRAALKFLCPRAPS